MHLLGGMDSFTKFMELAPRPNVTSEDFADFYLRQLFPRHGAASVIATDCGSQFNSKIGLEIAKLMVSEMHMGAAKHLQFSSQQKRSNRTLLSMLHKFCYNHPRDWARC